MSSPASTAPAIGVRYPLKLGRSIRKTNSARSFVQLKFSHVGAGVDTRRPGVLNATRDSCNVAFAAKADPTKSVSYACQRLRNVSDVGNYVLVFAADAFWLERVDDVFHSTRAGAMDDAVDVPDAGDDDFANEPESWMDVDTSGSPVTPDGNDAEEETARPVAGKSTPQAPGRKMVTGRTLQPMHEAVVVRTAGKTVAGKSLAPNTHSARDSFSNTDDANGGNVSEEVEEVEEASSSDDDGSSDDSDSSDSADSAEYTDRSSDED